MGDVPPTLTPIATRMSSSRYLNETYTNMATRQTVKMLSPLRFTIYLLFFFSPGTFSSTLRLHRDQRFLLPQDRGFSTVNAKEEFIHGIGADAKRRAARSAREDIAPGMYQHRNRRSAVEPPVPKVYGQVMHYFSSSNYNSTESRSHVTIGRLS